MTDAKAQVIELVYDEIDIRHVQAQVGHADISTTQIYTQVSVVTPRSSTFSCTAKSPRRKLPSERHSRL